ncbi:MAG: CoA transferase [Chloroflexi bacterium]|nr:CoA transferase [Chloroflexota bacterium]
MTKQPLDDIRVLDLSRVLAGPYCTMMLADLGAEVIKVEQPGRGDESRQWGPPFVGGESAYFLGINRNKQDITLNLQHERGRQLVRELVPHADVLVENFKLGSMEEWGLGYESLKALNPRLVYCNISGYGNDGPKAGLPGYDFILEAEAGFMSLNGPVEGPPMRAPLAIIDLTTGMFAATAIIAALRVRDSTGIGQRVDLSLLESQVAWLATVASNYWVSGKPPRRFGNGHGTVVPYEVFKAKDDFLALGVGNDSQFRRVCQALNRPEMADDARFASNPKRVENRPQLIEMMQAEFETADADEWVSRLRPLGVPIGRINSVDRVLNDPQVLHRQMVVEVERPTAGPVKVVGVPYKFSETPALIKSAPPTLGQHTGAVLQRLLGYSAEDIERLRAADGAADVI